MIIHTHEPLSCRQFSVISRCVEHKGHKHCNQNICSPICMSLTKGPSAGYYETSILPLNVSLIEFIVYLFTGIILKPKTQVLMLTLGEQHRCNTPLTSFCAGIIRFCYRCLTLLPEAIFCMNYVWQFSVCVYFPVQHRTKQSKCF